MERTAFLVAGIAMVAAVVAHTSITYGQADGDAAPVYGVKIPAGYRDWTMISVASVGDPVNDLRVKLGNDVAIKAFRDGRRPFPDGTIIARLAYRRVTSEENNAAIRPLAERSGLPPEQVTKLLDESFVAGPATIVQFMVKDSKKYASTGGWGFAEFTDGKPAGRRYTTPAFPAIHRPKIVTSSSPATRRNAALNTGGRVR